MKKILLFTSLFLILTSISWGQCQPDNCELTFTNMIDCPVEIRIEFDCPPTLPAPIPRTIRLDPGTSYSPNITKLQDHQPFPSPCDCTNINISKITVIRIGNMPYNTELDSSTSVFNQSTCCSENYATYSGCDVTLWMSCP